MKDKFASFVENKLTDKVMQIICVVLFLAYYFIGMMSYATAPIKPLYSLLVSSSTLAVVLRAFLCGLICLFSLLILYKYKLKFQWKWFILFIAVLLFNLFAIILSPLTYKYLHVEGLYKVVHIIELNPGLGTVVVMYLSALADFALAFCMLFILPTVFHDKKKILWIVLPVVLFGLLECSYSLIVERANYVYRLSHLDDPNTGYTHVVHATFGNKEDWGSFLTVAFCCSLVSLLFLGKTIKEKIFKAISIICLPVFAFCALVSLCKTAILAIGLCSVCALLCLWFMSRKKSKGIFIIVTVTYSLLLILVIIFLATNGFNLPILSKISSFVLDVLTHGAEYAAEGRAKIWLMFAQNVRTYNLFFGIGKANLNVYTKFVAKEGMSVIHNGLVYFFGSYGIVGFMLLVGLLGFVIFNLIKLRKINPNYPFIFIGLFIASFIFVLAESEVLIISSSAPIFMFNVLLVVLPQGLLLNYSNKKGEEL